ncbi:MAG: FeoB-associated Cys-rich membrane protein [Clostridia bacterium]|nr:FeoB-associated Cys-rich membrane protein [Clostridia bacterium]
MGVGEIILVIACALIVVGVVVSVIIKKKQGKHSCDCCSDCSHCNCCSQPEKKTDKK